MSQIEGALDSAGNQANNLSFLGNQASNAYNQFSPQANAAIENYARYLQQNPYTSAYSTALLNQATNGTTAAYQQAKAQLQAELAARGMSGSGLAAGSLGAIDASQAATMANAQNNIAMQGINQYGQNQATLANLLSGAANNAYGQASTNYGDAANLYNTIAQQYGQLGNQQEQYNMDYQNEQDQALAGLGSGLSSSLAGYFGQQQQNNQFNQLMGLYKNNPLGGLPPYYPGGFGYPSPFGYGYGGYGFGGIGGGVPPTPVSPNPSIFPPSELQNS
jgi:hypothetical protein